MVNVSTGLILIILIMRWKVWECKGRRKGKWKKVLFMDLGKEKMSGYAGNSGKRGE